MHVSSCLPLTQMLVPGDDIRRRMQVVTFLKLPA
jgi:hypothetical protein